MSAYSSGNSPPPGYCDSRLAGIWVCSGNHSDSNPRASHSRASSSAGMVYSVLKLKMPSFIAPSFSVGGCLTDRRDLPLQMGQAKEGNSGVDESEMKECVQLAMHMVILNSGSSQERSLR